MLEDRLTPALNIVIDYSMDTSGFFSDPTRRAALETAATNHEARLDSTMAAITPSGANTWKAIGTNPTTGAEFQVPNLNVPANTLIIYVGGSNTGGTEAGEGGPGGYAATGSRAFQSLVATRGVTGFSSWGGTVSFDTGTNWYFGSDPAGLSSSQVDFISVAEHELAHVLGFGTSTQFNNYVSGGFFNGPNSIASFGAPVKLSADLSHFAQGTRSQGQPIAMQPTLEFNQRVKFSALDLASLKDIGWTILSEAAPTLPTTPTPISPTVPVTPPTTPVTPPTTVPPTTETNPGGTSPVVPSKPAGKTVVVSGADDGSVQIYTASDSGALTLATSTFQPFAGFRGAVRSTVGDFNADGVADIALGTGPGGGSRVRILNGQNYTDLIPEFWAFEVGFNGGVFLASGDLNNDGRDEIIVTPDQGGGPRVRVLNADNGRLNTLADFFGINDTSFRGGARASLGDVNGDGFDDLVVAAGFGGGPRVSIIDGKTVINGTRQNLTGDFFAFEKALRNGVYVAVGDVDGDGKADLIFGAGPGGGPRVLTLSAATLLVSGSTAALANPLGNTFVGDTSQRGGVRVSAKDVNGDGIAEVVAGSGTSSQLFVLDGKSLFTKSSLIPFSTSSDGVYVG
jgi:hypothetical protein